MKRLIIILVLVFLFTDSSEMEVHEGDMFSVGRFIITRKQNLFQAYSQGHYSHYHKRAIIAIQEIQPYLESL